MRKFLLPVINLINLILVSIAWGLSGKSAILETINHKSVGCGNMYQIVWMGSTANVIGIVAFFLFCVACFATLVAFLPIKARKFVSCLAGLMYVGSGVMFLLSPKFYDYNIQMPKLTSAFIAFCVLILVAGAFSLLMSVLEFTSLGKKNAKNEKNGVFPRLKNEISEKKHGLFYVLGSCAIFVFSIIVIILIANTFRFVLILIYLGIALAFFVTLLIFEILDSKAKKANK